MRNIAAQIIFLCVMSIAQSAYAIEPLVKQDALAIKSRAALARILHQKGTVMEMSGNYSGALKTWLSAYNLDAGNRVVKKGLEDVRLLLMRLADERYRGALFDVQFGRYERAARDLGELRGMLGGVLPGVGAKIDEILAEIKSKDG